MLVSVWGPAQVIVPVTLFIVCVAACRRGPAGCRAARNDRGRAGRPYACRHGGAGRSGRALAAGAALALPCPARHAATAHAIRSGSNCSLAMVFLAISSAPILLEQWRGQPGNLTELARVPAQHAAGPARLDRQPAAGGQRRDRLAAGPAAALARRTARSRGADDRRACPCGCVDPARAGVPGRATDPGSLRSGPPCSCRSWRPTRCGARSSPTCSTSPTGCSAWSSRSRCWRRGGGCRSRRRSVAGPARRRCRCSGWPWPW